MSPGTETVAGIEGLLREARVLPVVRSDSRSTAHELVERVHQAGLDVVELTTTIPDWEELMHQVVNEHPDSLIGLGTVTRPEQARRALDLGARFLVSPFPVPEVHAAARSAEAVFVEGCFSPSEVAAASAHGLAKLFPAHVGGVRYLRSLLSVLPGARVIPTGGIGVQDAAEWLDAGAFAVGIGSGLQDPKLAHWIRTIRERPADPR